VAGTKIDEAFIGSCMTNIGHFRAAPSCSAGQRDIPVKLWVAPPTKMDESELIKEGHYAAFGAAGARTEMPGCSLCMGNQAQVREGATVMSTSTRNFPNRLGKNTNVYLASAELAAICSKLGRIPTVAEYHAAMGIINKDGRQRLPLHELRPDRGVRGDRQGTAGAAPTWTWTSRSHWKGAIWA
jgi:aconitate hydratase 2/2-methylisocitrate dehydratase